MLVHPWEPARGGAGRQDWHPLRPFAVDSLDLEPPCAQRLHSARDTAWDEVGAPTSSGLYTEKEVSSDR